MIGYKKIIILTVLATSFGIVMDKLGVIDKLAGLL